MIWIVQSPDDGHLFAVDRKTFVMPGDAGEVWCSRDESEAWTLAASTAGCAVGIDDAPSVTARIHVPPSVKVML